MKKKKEEIVGGGGGQITNLYLKLCDNHWYISTCWHLAVTCIWNNFFLNYILFLASWYLSWFIPNLLSLIPFRKLILLRVKMTLFFILFTTCRSLFIVTAALNSKNVQKSDLGAWCELTNESLLLLTNRLRLLPPELTNRCGRWATNRRRACRPIRIDCVRSRAVAAS